MSHISIPLTSTQKQDLFETTDLPDIERLFGRYY